MHLDCTKNLNLSSRIFLGRHPGNDDEFEFKNNRCIIKTKSSTRSDINKHLDLIDNNNPERISTSPDRKSIIQIVN